MKNVLVVDGLSKAFGQVQAVNDLHFAVCKGEVFGLLGHNGAGKSTSIECILGVQKAQRGTVRILGMDPVTDRKQLFEKVGVQFQETNYQAKITVEEICRLRHSLYRHPADWEELLSAFGLSGLRKQTVSNLSGGERQRLSVVLALIPNPELVFLDELTTGLDPKARRDVWKYLEKLKEKGLTILLTSHYMDEVEALCDRICILKKGRTVVLDTVASVIEQSPYNNLEESYLWYSGEEETANESF